MAHDIRDVVYEIRRDSFVKRVRISRELMISADLKDRTDRQLRAWGNERHYSPCHSCEWINEGCLYSLDSEALADELFKFLGGVDDKTDDEEEKGPSKGGVRPS